jgi:hypothetical protein
MRAPYWVLGPAGAILLIAFGSAWLVLGGGPAVTGLGVAGGLCLVAWAWLDGDRITAFSESRGARHGSGALLVSALGAMVGVLAYAVAVDHDHTWDLTQDGRHTLADQSVAIAEGLDRDVKVYAFFREESAEEKAFVGLVERLREHTGHLTIERVDPLRNPLMAEQYAITTDNGTVVLVSGDDRQRLEADFSEEALVAALVRLSSGASHRVCWATGHGEAGADDDYEPTGYGAAVIKLEHHNYEVVPQAILTAGVDRGCEALIVAGPTSDWLPREREALAAYVAEGGRALVLLEAGVASELAVDLGRYGVDARDDLVLESDPSRLIAQGDPSFLAFYGDAYALHPIVRDLQGLVGMRSVRSVGAAEGERPGLVVQEILSTSASSWGEAGWRDPTVELIADGAERVGPVPVMVVVEVTDPAAIEVARSAAAPEVAMGEGVLGAAGDEGALVPADFAPEAGGRLVVVGDADFASNQLISVGNNQDVFLNAVAWLVDEADQLGERPEADDAQALSLTVAQEVLLWLVSVFLVPLGAVVAAIIVMVRRRFL